MSGQKRFENQRLLCGRVNKVGLWFYTAAQRGPCLYQNFSWRNGLEVVEVRLRERHVLYILTGGHRSFGLATLVQEPKDMNLTWINLPLLKAIDRVCMQAFSYLYS